MATAESSGLGVLSPFCKWLEMPEFDDSRSKLCHGGAVGRWGARVGMQAHKSPQRDPWSQAPTPLEAHIMRMAPKLEGAARVNASRRGQIPGSQTAHEFLGTVLCNRVGYWLTQKRRLTAFFPRQEAPQTAQSSSGASPPVLPS
jgi:hypothetical protein